MQKWCNFSITLGFARFRKSFLLLALKKSGRQDLNLRPLDPQSSALARLRHVPCFGHLADSVDNLVPK